MTEPIENKSKRRRCINLDWLEVDVSEPADGRPRNADYFRRVGLIVIEREYGTRVYAEMFTIQGSDGLPLLEVRRNPKTPMLAPNNCHLRLVNRTCYYDDAATQLAIFIQQHNYTFNRIVRVDLCLDFELFDSRDIPDVFLRRYLERVYSKINQSNVTAHGADTFTGRSWNSISWGSPKSDIGTKFYNKTMELYDPILQTYSKPYILWAWKKAGLIDDPIFCKRTGWNPKKKEVMTYTPEIWRLEFSIRSGVRNWFTIELNGKAKAYQSIRNWLDCYSTKEKQLVIFASLCQHYFHFKHYQEGVRKDRCRDKELFDFRTIQTIYKIGKGDLPTTEKPDTSLVRLLARLKEFRDRTFDKRLKEACDILIESLQNSYGRQLLSTPAHRLDLMAYQSVLRQKLAGNQTDPAVLLKFIKTQLRLNDATTKIF